MFVGRCSEGSYTGSLFLYVHTCVRDGDMCMQEKEGENQSTNGSAQNTPASIPGLWALTIVTAFNSWPGMGTDQSE